MQFRRLKIILVVFAGMWAVEWARPAHLVAELAASTWQVTADTFGDVQADWAEQEAEEKHRNWEGVVAAQETLALLQREAITRRIAKLNAPPDAGTRHERAQRVFVTSVQTIFGSSSVKEACNKQRPLDIMACMSGKNGHGLAGDIRMFELPLPGSSVDAWHSNACYGAIEWQVRKPDSGVCFPYAFEPWHLEAAGTPACQKYGKWDLAPPDAGTPTIGPIDGLQFVPGSK